MRVRPPITASESVVSGDVILPTNSQTGVQDVAAEQSTCQLKPALAIYSRYLAKQGRDSRQAAGKNSERKEATWGKGFLFLFCHELARQHWVSLRYHN